MTTTPSKSQAFFIEAPFHRQLSTLAIAMVGGLLFQWLGIPAGAMSGAMIATAAASSLLPGSVVPLGKQLRLLAMLVSGISIGASVTRDVLSNIITYPASITGMMICVIAMTATSAAITIVFAKWDRATAVLAAVPGALAYILSVIQTTRASSTRVVAVQMMRVFFLMALVPVIVAESGLILAPVNIRPDDPWWIFGVECVLGCAVGLLFTRLKLAGGMLLGAMLASGLAHGLEFAHGRAPWIVMVSGQILIGAWSGSRFVGFDWRLFLRQSPSILGSIVASLVIAGVFAFFVSGTLGLSFGAVFLAYSPGGFEAMAVLALALGFDPFYVAAHHLSRFFLLNFGMPLTLNLLIGKDGRKSH
jgi:membrane AbrB-like protein